MLVQHAPSMGIQTYGSVIIKFIEIQIGYAMGLQ